MALFSLAYEYTMGFIDPAGELRHDPQLSPAVMGLASAMRDEYFKGIRGYDINDQRVSSKLFDTAVVLGLHKAVEAAQVAVCELGTPVIVNGIMDPATLAAINGADPGMLLKRIVFGLEQYCSPYPHTRKLLERVKQVPE